MRWYQLSMQTFSGFDLQCISMPFQTKNNWISFKILSERDSTDRNFRCLLSFLNKKLFDIKTDLHKCIFWINIIYLATNEPSKKKDTEIPIKIYVYGVLSMNKNIILKNIDGHSRNKLIRLSKHWLKFILLWYYERKVCT